MGHYDLNRMGWQQFEHMLQALAKAELGNGGPRPFEWWSFASLR